MKKKVASAVRRANDVLPTGTAVVGGGLAISAFLSYGFVIIALNSLEGSAKASFSAFWAVIFIAGPGFFLPIEQEVARAVAHRKAQGIGGRPVVVRAAQIGAIILGVLIVAAIVATPWLSSAFYGGNTFFTVSLCVGLLAFALLHLTRGVLAGEGRFTGYGELIALDSAIRFALAIGLWATGVESAALFALCLGLSPLLTLPFVLRGQRRELAPGPDAPLSELSVNLGWLLAASVFAQALAYAPLLGVNLLATDSEEYIVVGFASAFFVARVPVLLFQAVQGTLLPKLAGLAGSGKHDEFRRGVVRLLVLVVAVAVAGIIGSFLLGPTVGKIFFKDFTMSAGYLALLAAGSGAFIIALTVAQALMALGGLRTIAVSWGIGLCVSLGMMSIVEGLEMRVDLGLLIGSVIAAVFMAIGLVRRQGQMADAGIGSLIEAIEHEPIEI